MATWPPKIQLHKASGQARCRIDGKDHYLGAYGSPEAAAAYARLLASLAEGQTPARTKDPPPLTVAQIVADWSARVLPSYSDPAGEPSSYGRALLPLLQLFGSLPARDLDACRLEQVRQDMIRRGWCANVINRRIVRLRTVWRWAESQNYVPRGSWAHLRTLPGLKRNNRSVRHTEAVKPAAWTEVLAVVRHSPPVLRDMLLVQWWSGMRTGELVRLNLGEIERTGAIWYYRPGRHKMAYLGQERVIALGKKCQALLQKRLRQAAAEGWLFLSRYGRPYTPRSYAQAVRREARRLGIRGLHPYKLRHSFKARIVRLMGLEAARAAMGHASLGTTAGYASQIDLKTATDVARKCG